VPPHKWQVPPAYVQFQSAQVYTLNTTDADNDAAATEDLKKWDGG